MPKSWLVRGVESGERARRRMQLLGVTPNGHPLWTPWEVSPVTELAPAYGLIFPMVGRRTKPGVYSKAQRLGVARKAALPWSDNEIPRLRKVYPLGTREEILAAFPGRTYTAISKAANARGIYRKKKPESPTGIRILDQILVRATAKGFTRSDLDCFMKSGTYFRRRQWRLNPDGSLHCRTAVLLGGTVRCNFSNGL